MTVCECFCGKLQKKICFKLVHDYWEDETSLCAFIDGKKKEIVPGSKVEFYYWFDFFYRMGIKFYKNYFFFSQDILPPIREIIPALPKRFSCFWYEISRKALSRSLFSYDESMSKYYSPAVKASKHYIPFHNYPGHGAYHVLRSGYSVRYQVECLGGLDKLNGDIEPQKEYCVTDRNSPNYKLFSNYISDYDLFKEKK